MKEYKIITVSYGNWVFQPMEDQLNQLALEGWTVLFFKDLLPAMHSMLFILERYKNQTK